MLNVLAQFATIHHNLEWSQHCPLVLSHHHHHIPHTRSPRIGSQVSHPYHAFFISQQCWRYILYQPKLSGHLVKLNILLSIMNPHPSQSSDMSEMHLIIIPCCSPLIEPPYHILSLQLAPSLFVVDYSPRCAQEHLTSYSQSHIMRQIIYWYGSQKMGSTSASSCISYGRPHDLLTLMCSHLHIWRNKEHVIPWLSCHPSRITLYIAKLETLIAMHIWEGIYLLLLLTLVVVSLINTLVSYQTCYQCFLC